MHVRRVVALWALLAPMVMSVGTVGAQAATGDGFVVAAGVVQFDGSPVAGASVAALAEPGSAALSAAGHTGMPPVPLGEATTGANGGFVVTGALTSLPLGYTNSDRGVNIDVVATNGARSITWMYTLYAATGRAGVMESVRATNLPSTGKLSDGRIAPLTHFDLGNGHAWDIGDDPAHWIGPNGREIGVAGRDAAARVAVEGPSRMTAYAHAYLQADVLMRQRMLRATTAARPTVPDLTCTIYRTNSWRTNVQEHYMNVYSVSGIPVTVTEGTSSSSTHTMGVAALSGSSLSASGTNSVTFAIGSSQAGVADSTVNNRVNYRLWVNTCDPKSYWKPYSLYDFLTDWSYAGHVNYSHCSPKAAGNDWFTSTAADATYSAGVSFPGLSLSAQSGYSSSQRLDYNFNVAGMICGSNIQGPAQSSLVSAHL